MGIYRSDGKPVEWLVMDEYEQALHATGKQRRKRTRAGDTYRDDEGNLIRKAPLSSVRKKDKNPPPKRRRRTSVTISLSKPKRKRISKTIVSKRNKPKKTVAKTNRRKVRANVGVKG